VNVADAAATKQVIVLFPPSILLHLSSSSVLCRSQDLNRQIIKSETASVAIPDIEFEIPVRATPQIT
jgi:hypothetical protein